MSIALTSLSLSLSILQSAAPGGPRYSLGDHDGDGLLDVYVVHPAGSDVLFRNLGDGSFLDVTAEAGLADLVGTRDALWQDFDGDGSLDLYVSFLGRSGRLFQNTGVGTLVDVTEHAGFSPSEGELDAAWIDYDADAQPDLYVATAGGDRFYRNLGQGRFEAVELVPADRALGVGGVLAPNAPPFAAEPTDEAGGSTPPALPRGPRGALDPVVLARGSGASSSYPYAPGSPSRSTPLIAALTPCANALRDAVGGGCGLQASATPTLGMLFPMTTALNVTANGRVGVGTDTPDKKLHVVQPAPSGDGIGVLFGPPFGAGPTYDGNQRIAVAASNGNAGISLVRHGQIGFLTEVVADGLSFKEGYQGELGERMRIAAGGNVGIGTNVPQAKLDVNGTVQIGDTLTLAPSGDQALDILNGSIYEHGEIFIHAKGVDNTAIGPRALESITLGSANSAAGAKALHLNTSGSVNVAMGGFALLNNTTGSENTGIGHLALGGNTTGNANTAVGRGALASNVVGTDNTAIGFQAGFNTTGSSNILIGNDGVAGESLVVRIGRESNHLKAFIAGIRGKTTGVANAIPVLIDSNGQLGTVSSSRRFKDEINDMGSATDRLLELRPVTFRYKPEVQSGERPLEYGLIAEEVAEIFPDLVVYDENGQPFTVKYHLLSSMLLNELKKQASEIDELRNELEQQESRLSALEALATKATPCASPGTTGQ